MEVPSLEAPKSQAIGIRSRRLEFERHYSRVSLPRIRPLSTTVARRTFVSSETSLDAGQLGRAGCAWKPRRSTFMGAAHREPSYMRTA